MYAGYTTSPPLTNNPFVPGDGGASLRYPDLSTSPTNTNMNAQQQYTSWVDPQQSQQQQQGMYQQYPQQTQPLQQQMTLGYAPQQAQQQQQVQMGNNGYLSPAPPGGYAGGGGTTHFQPSSSFGQQLSAAANISGSSYSYLQQQPQSQQVQQNPNAYNPAQQQLQNNPGYIAQFDPYSSLGHILSDGSGVQQHQQNQYGQGGPSLSSSSSITPSTPNSSTFPSTPSYGLSASGDPHPRDYIRTHKAEIERWDAYAWKQFLNAFEALTKAWEGRKAELAGRVGALGAQLASAGGSMQYDGGYYVAQIQQEGGRLQGLQREAENNYDSVAASMFQMREVFSGYRQSSDLASKSRVREATNAAMHGLPGWPQPY